MTDDISGFWSRESLRHVRDYALASRCNPYGVLGVVIARVIAATDPNIVGPATVGGEWSLNLIIALVGRSGQGKDACHAAGFSAVKLPHTVEEGIGSGEGIARIFHTDKDGQQENRRAYLTASEVDRLTAIASRQGSTLTATLRQVWTGSSLGFSNSQKHTKTNVAAHSYRAVVEIGVQPEGAAPLLSDTKGTAQRMLWLPVAQIDLPDELPDRPDPINITLPSDHRLVLAIPAEAETAIIEHRRAVLAMPLTGSVDGIDPLDGHIMLTRLKVAAGLMLLDGRCGEITAEDWVLAGQLIGRSNRIRATLLTESANVRRRANEARASDAAERENITAEAKVRRAANAVLARLERVGTATRGDVRRSLRSDLRPEFEPAIAILIDAGSVIETTDGIALATEHVDTAVHTSTPGQGQKTVSTSAVHVSTSPRDPDTNVDSVDTHVDTQKPRSGHVDSNVHMSTSPESKSDSKGKPMKPTPRACKNCGIELAKANTDDDCGECGEHSAVKPEPRHGDVWRRDAIDRQSRSLLNRRGA